MLSAVPRPTRDTPRLSPAAVLAGLATAGALVALVPSAARLVPPCPVHAVTGIDCPGCGTTRGVVAALRGDLAAAIGHNAFAVLVALPTLAALWVAWYRVVAHGRRWPSWTRSAALWRSWIGAAVAFGVARNLPWEPFTALAA